MKNSVSPVRGQSVLGSLKVLNILCGCGFLFTQALAQRTALPLPPPPPNTLSIDSARARLDKEPKSAKAQLQMAFAYYSKRQFSKAIPFFLQATKSDKEKKLAYFGLAYSYVGSNRLSDAASTLEKLAKLDFTNRAKSDTLADAGVLYRELRSHEKAESAFLRCVTLNPKNFAGTVGLGLCKAVKRDFSSAKALFLKATSVATTNASKAKAYAYASFAAKELHQSRESKTLLDKAQKLQSDILKSIERESFGK